VPYQAKLIEEFLPEEEMLRYSQAIARVFARLGEKKNRNRARVKFVVAKLGIDGFRKEVYAEREKLPHDPRWTDYLKEVYAWREDAGTQAHALNGQSRPEGFDAWHQTNVYKQRQPGYAVATVTLPLGDITSDQLRALANLVHQYAGDNARTTVEQNIVLRWVSESDLPALYEDLKKLGLAQSGAGTIVDVVACPGTDTCKLGIASSRGLAGELRDRMLHKTMQLDAAVQNLRIKISGCFNSCGQHHVADIGFYGNSRSINGYTVPHFQVVLGGKWHDNAGSYGMAIGAVPSKRIPQLVEALTERYVKDRNGAESFQDFCARLGKKSLKEIVDQFTQVPPHDTDSSYYTDWGDPRKFSIGDMGTGECAGEVVSLAQFGFTAAESTAFEAGLAMEEKNYARADELAFQAMLESAKTLVRTEFRDVPNTPDAIVSEFKARFVDTGKFNDKYHRDQFANYLIGRHTTPPPRIDEDHAHRIIDEAQMFIDASHKCYARVSAEVSQQPVQVTVPAK
ncbi:MAG: nitrite/sulfite reductase, partial [Tepidisphaeraceae bacterium]